MEKKSSTLNHFHLWEENYVLNTCAKVVHFEHMWKEESLVFLENLFVGLFNFSINSSIPI